MEYAIFIFSASTALLIYHLWKYPTSGYGKFEYYLNGEVNEIVRFIVSICLFIWIGGIAAGLVYFGGELIKRLFF